MTTGVSEAPPAGPAVWWRCQIVAGDVWGSLGPSEPSGSSRRALLEEALANHVASAGDSRLDPRRQEAVLRRLGLRGQPPLTLAAAGRLAGLTGERVRQLEARVRRQYAVPGSQPPLLELEAALAAVARAAPLPASAVGRLLKETGLSAGPFCVESLICAAGLLGCDLPFVVSGSGTGAVVLPRLAGHAAAHAGLIESRARRQAERCGAFTVASLEEELAGGQVVVPRRQIKVVLETWGAVVACGERWFSFSDARTLGTFVRASRRMLAVTAPQSVESLHDGLRRHNAFRRLPTPPPPAVLAEVYRCHPAFVVEHGLVSSSEPIDRSVMGPLNLSIVDLLREAPGGVMARSELLDSCHRAGLNLTSVNLYTTYSECLERVGPALFAPRGAAVPPPGEVAPIRTASRRRADCSLFGWTADGRPWMAGWVTPGTWANGVVHVPAGLRPALEGRRFSCQTGDGSPVTTLGVDGHGNSWGWTGYLRRAGVEPGRLVRAIFDTQAGTATLDVVSPDDLRSLGRSR